MSPRIFNIMVDAVVREWLRSMFGEDANINDREQVASFVALFYADDGILADRCAIRHQMAIDKLVSLFGRVGLRTNTAKTKCVAFVPGRIRTRLSEQAYRQKQRGVETARDWARRRVQCDICHKEMNASSLDQHLEAVHDVFRSKVLDIDLDLSEDRPETTFRAQQHEDGRFYYPVPDCNGTAPTPWAIRRHFAMRHPGDLVHTPDEQYPRCGLCGMQTNPDVLGRGHEETALCRQGQERRTQYAAVAAATKALDIRFTAYGDELERVETFKYLGRLMTHDDNDAQAVKVNLRKARKCWGRVSRVLRSENATSRVCGMFYKATVQAVLLFGAETWNVSTAMLARLEGWVFF